jgi:ABC-type antimicrobial peptide transport system permease subunit
MKKILELSHFVIKDLRSDGWRTTLTIINLLVFISCFFALEALAEAAYKFGNQPTDRNALLIVSRNIFEPAESVLTANDLFPARELIPDYVKSVSPLIIKIIQANGILVQLRAATLQDMQNVHSLQLTEGKWPIGKNEVVIGEGAAVNTNWKIGDTVSIYGSKFRISGIVRAPGTKFSSVWMTLNTANELFAPEGEFQIGWVQLQSGVDGEMIRKKLQNDPRLASGFDVYFADNLYKQYTNAVADMKGISSLLVILALFSIMLGTYCNIFLILSERSREITILRAMGFQAKTILRIITYRTMLQVMIAYMLSWIIASILLHIFNIVNPLNLHSIPLPVSISPLALLFGLFLALIFSFAGVWFPTRQLLTRSVASLIQK